MQRHKKLEHKQIKCIHRQGVKYSHERRKFGNKNCLICICFSCPRQLGGFIRLLFWDRYNIFSFFYWSGKAGLCDFKGCSQKLLIPSGSFLVNQYQCVTHRSLLLSVGIGLLHDSSTVPLELIALVLFPTIHLSVHIVVWSQKTRRSLDKICEVMKRTTVRGYIKTNFPTLFVYIICCIKLFQPFPSLF